MGGGEDKGVQEASGAWSGIISTGRARGCWLRLGRASAWAKTSAQFPSEEPSVAVEWDWLWLFEGGLSIPSPEALPGSTCFSEMGFLASHWVIRRKPTRR